MRACILRLRKNYNSFVWFGTIKQHILYRFRKGGTDQAIVEAIDRATSFTYPTFCNVHKHIAFKVHAIYIRLPYHLVWASDIYQALSDWSNNKKFPELVQVFVDDKAVGVKAAWQLRMLALSLIIRKF